MLLTLILMTVAFFVSATLTYHFTHPHTVLYIVDEPNHRSLHTQPIPVSGGLAILAGIASTVIIAHQYYPLPAAIFWLGLSGTGIAIISFIDDCRQVPALYRLLVHFLAATLFLWKTQWWISAMVLPGFFWEWPDFFKIVGSLLFVVWMVNLYNFMDGMDGFAGGMAICGFTTLAILGSLTGQSLFMLLNLLIASATAGFLLFNFPPAKIFMGDVGSSSLGFLAAASSLWGEQLNIFPWWIALLIFSPFIVDATVTLLRRLAQGERIWLAHKSHYYQRLVQLDWGHKRTVLWEYLLMIACSFSALIALTLPIYAQWGILIGWGLIYWFLMELVKRRETK